MINPLKIKKVIQCRTISVTTQSTSIFVIRFLRRFLALPTLAAVPRLMFPLFTTAAMASFIQSIVTNCSRAPCSSRQKKLLLKLLNSVCALSLFKYPNSICSILFQSILANLIIKIIIFSYQKCLMVSGFVNRQTAQSSFAPYWASRILKWWQCSTHTTRRVHSTDH